MADEKVTVVNDGSSAAGMVVAVIGIIAVLIILYVVFGTNLLSGSTQTIDANVKVEAPSKN